MVVVLSAQATTDESNYNATANFHTCISSCRNTSSSIITGIGSGMRMKLIVTMFLAVIVHIFTISNNYFKAPLSSTFISSSSLSSSSSSSSSNNVNDTDNYGNRNQTRAETTRKRRKKFRKEGHNSSENGFGGFVLTNDDDSDSDPVLNVNPRYDTGSWMGNVWIPPAGWELLSIPELQGLWDGTSIFFIGDSTSRRTALALYYLLNQTEMTITTATDTDTDTDGVRHVSVSTLNSWDVIDVNRRVLNEPCIRYNFDSSVDFKFGICRDMPTNHYHHHGSNIGSNTSSLTNNDIATTGSTVTTNNANNNSNNNNMTRRHHNKRVLVDDRDANATNSIIVSSLPSSLNTSNTSVASASEGTKGSDNNDKNETTLLSSTTPMAKNDDTTAKMSDSSTITTPSLVQVPQFASIQIPCLIHIERFFQMLLTSNEDDGDSYNKNIMNNQDAKNAITTNASAGSLDYANSTTSDANTTASDNERKMFQLLHRDIEIIVVGVGLWDIIRANDCKSLDGRDKRTLIQDVIKLQVAFLNNLNNNKNSTRKPVTIIWRTSGYEDNPRSIDGVSAINEMIMDTIDLYNSNNCSNHTNNSINGNSNANDGDCRDESSNGGGINDKCKNQTHLDIVLPEGNQDSHEEQKNVEEEGRTTNTTSTAGTALASSTESTGNANCNVNSYSSKKKNRLLYVNWSKAIKPRSFGSDRVNGDIKAHYGPEPRIVQIQMITNLLFDHEILSY